MSFSFNTTGHDTRLYDPDRDDNHIVAVFEDDAAAERAQAALLEAGVKADEVQMIAAPVAEQSSEAAGAGKKTAGDQIMDAFMSLLSSSGDHEDYAHAIGRGHAMVVVSPSGESDRHQIIQVLERSNPIDFDAKLEEWRQAGYEGLSQRPPGDADELRMERQQTPERGSRVRSYVRPRRSGPGAQPNATPGVESSGMNTPRK